MPSKFKVGDKVKHTTLADVKGVITGFKTTQSLFCQLDNKGPFYHENYLELDNIHNNSIGMPGVLPPTSYGFGGITGSSVQGSNMSIWDWTADAPTLPHSNPPKVKCDCGSHKTYGEDSPYHSDWCALYVYYKSAREKLRDDGKRI